MYITFRANNSRTVILTLLCADCLLRYFCQFQFEVHVIFALIHPRKTKHFLFGFLPNGLHTFTSKTASKLAFPHSNQT